MAIIPEAAYRKKLGPPSFRRHSYVVNRLQTSGLIDQYLARCVPQDGLAEEKPGGRSGTKARRVGHNPPGHEYAR